MLLPLHLCNIFKIDYYIDEETLAEVPRAIMVRSGILCAESKEEHNSLYFLCICQQFYFLIEINHSLKF